MHIQERESRHKKITTDNYEKFVTLYKNDKTENSKADKLRMTSKPRDEKIENHI